MNLISPVCFFQENIQKFYEYFESWLSLATLKSASYILYGYHNNLISKYQLSLGQLLSDVFQTNCWAVFCTLILTTDIGISKDSSLPNFLFYIANWWDWSLFVISAFHTHKLIYNTRFTDFLIHINDIFLTSNTWWSFSPTYAFFIFSWYPFCIYLNIDNTREHTNYTACYHNVVSLAVWLSNDICFLIL